jgi:hypothetical protein
VDLRDLCAIVLFFKGQHDDTKTTKEIRGFFF